MPSQCLAIAPVSDIGQTESGKHLSVTRPMGQEKFKCRFLGARRTIQTSMETTRIAAFSSRPHLASANQIVPRLTTSRP